MRQHLADSRFKPIFLARLTFPNNLHPPSVGFELLPDLSVALKVPGKLRSPIRVGRWSAPP